MPVEFLPAIAYLTGVVVWTVLLHRPVPAWAHAGAAAAGVLLLGWLGPWWWPGVSVLGAAVLGAGLVLVAGRHLSRAGLMSLMVTVAVSSLAGMIATAAGLLLGGAVALVMLLRQRGAARALLDVQDMAAAIGVTPAGFAVPEPGRLELAVSSPRRVRLPVVLLVAQLAGCAGVALLG